MGTTGALARAHSDLTDLRRARQAEEYTIEALESVLETEEASQTARSYLVWACEQLGLPAAYHGFAHRADATEGLAALHLSQSSHTDSSVATSTTSDDERAVASLDEEEYSLDDMIHDVEMTRVPSWQPNRDVLDVDQQCRMSMYAHKGQHLVNTLHNMGAHAHATLTDLRQVGFIFFIPDRKLREQSTLGKDQKKGRRKEKLIKSKRKGERKKEKDRTVFR
jgi:hypothetical protein